MFLQRMCKDKYEIYNKMLSISILTQLQSYETERGRGTVGYFSLIDASTKCQ